MSWALGFPGLGFAFLLLNLEIYQLDHKLGMFPCHMC